MAQQNNQPGRQMDDNMKRPGQSGTTEKPERNSSNLQQERGSQGASNEAEEKFPEKNA